VPLDFINELENKVDKLIDSLQKTRNENKEINSRIQQLEQENSTLKNEFTRLPQEEIVDGSKKLMVGRSIYDYWLREWYGVDPDDGAALYRADEYDDTDTDIRIFGTDTLTTDINNKGYTRPFSISLLIFSIIIGLVLNWVAFYLSIMNNQLSI